jgi:transposase InsO family protein
MMIMRAPPIEKLCRVCNTKKLLSNFDIDESVLDKRRNICKECLTEYFISCLDDCSRKVASKWSERKRTIDVLDVLEEWIVINGKPKKVMRDNGKQFTSKIFKRFLEHNNIKDKPIPKSYPQLQGKVEAYNKIVKNEFLAVEDIRNIDDGKLRYEMFVKAYNETREHGGINGLTPSEKFLQTFNIAHNRNDTNPYSFFFLCKYSLNASIATVVNVVS